MRRMGGRLALLLTTMATAVLLACGVAFAVIDLGTNGDDNITGTNDADILDGQDGNDTITALGGADNVHGGAGNDRLFGGDQFQNFNGGADTINGEGGKDLIVGGAAADALSGGPGDDTIMEGPGDDFISVASIPASKDTEVDCGPGVDEVEADPLDVLRANCENVTIVRRQPDEEPDLEYIPTPEDRTEVPEGANPPSGEIGTRASGSHAYNCSHPPNWRGSRRCGGISGVYSTEWVGIKVTDAGGNCRDINWWANAEGKYLGFAQVGECIDRFDWIYAGGKSWMYDRYVTTFAESAGNRWTWSYGFIE